MLTFRHPTSHSISPHHLISLQHPTTSLLSCPRSPSPSSVRVMDLDSLLPSANQVIDIMSSPTETVKRKRSESPDASDMHKIPKWTPTQTVKVVSFANDSLLQSIVPDAVMERHENAAGAERLANPWVSPLPTLLPPMPRVPYLHQAATNAAKRLTGPPSPLPHRPIVQEQSMMGQPRVQIEAMALKDLRAVAPATIAATYEPKRILCFFGDTDLQTEQSRYPENLVVWPSDSSTECKQWRTAYKA